MKNIGKFAVLGAVLAASVSAFATTIQIGSYATGGAPNGNANSALNYAGYFAANGPTWAAIPSGAQITSGTNNSVAIGAGSPWVNAMPNTTWVSNVAGTNPASGPSVVDPNGYYTFTSSIGALAAGTYTFNLSVLADDTVAVFLNGANIIQAGPIGNDAACATGAGANNCYTVTNYMFAVGGGSTNDLTFVVEQTGLADFGLDFSGTISNTPEPSSLMLLGTGLVGAAGMLFRRRRVTV